MAHKDFQLNYPEMNITVHFNLEFDGQHTFVDTIQIMPESSDLPKNHTLEEVNGEWVLCSNTQMKQNGITIPVREVIKNKYTNDIVKRIIQLSPTKLLASRRN